MGRRSADLVCRILNNLYNQAHYYTVSMHAVPEDYVLNHKGINIEVSELQFIEAEDAVVMYEIINNFWEVYDSASIYNKLEVLQDLRSDINVAHAAFEEKYLGQPRNDWYTRRRTTEEWYADALHQFAS
jgi:hypothetical protein